MTRSKRRGFGCSMLTVARHVVLLSVVLLSPFEVAAEEDHAAAKDLNSADLRVSSLLDAIDIAISQDPDASFLLLTQMLLSAQEIQLDASPKGRSLIRDFPARLRQHAERERNSGDPTKAANYMTFAALAAHSPDLDPTDQPSAAQKPAPVASTKASPEPQSGVGRRAGDTKPDDSPVTAPLTAVPPAQDRLPAALPLSVQRNLLERGQAMLKLRDISAARMLFRRAAEAGLGIAAVKLGNTYDPVYLQENALRGIQPDPSEAEAWYRKAAAMGETLAEQSLQSLQRHALNSQR